MLDEPTLFPIVEASRKMPDLDKVISEVSIEDNYRWWLRYGWGAGPAIAWIGLNPSDAGGKKRFDPTMLREIGFSFRWGFGSLVKLNLYPFIAADPKALHRWRADNDHSAREAYISNAHQAAGHIGKCDMVMAAWGKGAGDTDADDFMAVVVSMLGRHVPLHCLGKTNDGCPKHTLARGIHRVPDDAKPIEWRA